MTAPQSPERVIAKALDDVERVFGEVLDLIGPPPGWTPSP